MNCKDIHHYWCQKYAGKFGKPYTSAQTLKELALLKKLLIVYNEYVILEALDCFIDTYPIDKVTISYFATPKVFLGINKDLLKYKNIIKYYRLLKNKNIKDEKREKIKKLIDEYIDYTTALITFDSEKERMREIITELEGEDDATRLGR